MRTCLFILILSLSAFTVTGQNEKSLSVADSLYKLAQYGESANAYETYFNSHMDASVAVDFYKAAVAFSKSGNAEKAVLWLQKSVDNGMDDKYLTEIRFDLNFYPIRHTKSWKEFFKRNTLIFEEEALKISHPEIRNELLELWQSDQYYRQLIFGKYNGRAPKELGVATEAVDRFNAIRIEQIVDEIGWPSYSKVGRDGAHAAWNIIQHAVFNPPLMKRCLAEMEKALKNQEVDGIDYAYLYDRFQAVCYLGKQDFGIVRRVPIREEYLVDQRRKEIGFKKTLKEYLGEYTPKSKEECEKIEQELLEKYKTNLEKAKPLLAVGDYEGAAKYYRALMSCYGYIQTEDIYNYAKIKSRQNTGRSRFQAIRYIRCLSVRGFNDVKKLQEEPAFENIRAEKGFKEIVEIIKKYNTSSGEN